MDNKFKIKLYYSKQKLLHSKIFTITDNTSIKNLWDLIDVTSFYPEFDNQNYFIGVFGKIRSEDYIIQKGDRLEIYEHILLDPKERRKLIASKNKKD
tara:strand:- start:107 stop:397 length:291 start_codon:yes stop_codon:yes gene_type:complete